MGEAQPAGREHLIPAPAMLSFDMYASIAAQRAHVAGAAGGVALVSFW